MPVMSVPTGPMMAKTLSTAADCPSLIPMNNKVPALKDSNSIVALSVSISARISPSFTSSPTFFNHVATVPSVIVSLRRGIVTTTTPFGSPIPAFPKGEGDDSEILFSSGIGFLISSPTTPPLGVGGLISPEISSPSFPMMAKRESTEAVSPSLIPMYNKVPELKDSNSIVALSVSISARISPSFIVSPTFFNQVATVPSVIVSLKRGIVIFVAIIIVCEE